VQGPENTAPAVTGTPGAPYIRAGSSRTQPFSLEGYGATVRLHTRIFGDLPASFEVDAEVRRRMERDVRAIEAGYVPPCAPNFVVAHYVARRYYLVLFEETPDGWRTYATFNYRVEGPDLLTTNVYEEGQLPLAGPWPIELRRPLYDRYFGGLGERAYPGPDHPPGQVVPAEEEIWRVTAESVPIDAYIAALLDARGSRVQPPSTGDGGLMP
jgi:hypothetical protein